MNNLFISLYVQCGECTETIKNERNLLNFLNEMMIFCPDDSLEAISKSDFYFADDSFYNFLNKCMQYVRGLKIPCCIDIASNIQ